MKQMTLFGDEYRPVGSSKYSNKVEAPIYKPRGKKPHLLELYNKGKADRLIREIGRSGLPDDEKAFLIISAYRHIVFNYEKIADYYAQASSEMQDLMEKSALVIIDFEQAIEWGFVKLCDDIKEQYLSEYGE